jgi:hypothetical protein
MLDTRIDVIRVNANAQWEIFDLKLALAKSLFSIPESTSTRMYIRTILLGFPLTSPACEISRARPNRKR